MGESADPDLILAEDDDCSVLQGIGNSGKIRHDESSLICDRVLEKFPDQYYGWPGAPGCSQECPKVRIGCDYYSGLSSSIGDDVDVTCSVFQNIAEMGRSGDRGCQLR